MGFLVPQAKVGATDGLKVCQHTPSFRRACRGQGSFHIPYRIDNGRIRVAWLPLDGRNEWNAREKSQMTKSATHRLSCGDGIIHALMLFFGFFDRSPNRRNTSEHVTKMESRIRTIMIQVRSFER